MSSSVLSLPASDSRCHTSTPLRRSLLQTRSLEHDFTTVYTPTHTFVHASDLIDAALEAVADAAKIRLLLSKKVPCCDRTETHFRDSDDTCSTCRQLASTGRVEDTLEL